MNLSAPKVITFIVSAILVLIGIIASYVSIAAITPYALWFIVIGYVVLAIGTMVEGM